MELHENHEIRFLAGSMVSATEARGAESEFGAASELSSHVITRAWALLVILVMEDSPARISPAWQRL